MIPEYIPVFTEEDILVGSQEYREGKKATASGWLRELFLYGPPEQEFVQITPSDFADHENATKLFRQIAHIPKTTLIEDWEDTVSAKEQAKALNQLRINMEYTVIHEL